MRAPLPIHRLLAAAALLLAPAPLAAQAVQGRVVDAATRLPVPGALVELVGPDGARRDAAVTGGDGGYAVRAAQAGTYTLRVERVGYQTSVSAPFTLREGETAQMTLSPSPRRVTLPEVTVQSKERDCTERPARDEDVAVVWEEARKALSSAAHASERRLYAYAMRQYRRQFTLPFRTPSGPQETEQAALSREPFLATPLAELVAHGYVQPRGDSIIYHAPDASTLLSDEFLAQHCFGLVEGEGPRAGLVGLAFSPVRGRRRPDVRGVLWLERESSALRHLEYAYTGLDYAGPMEELGGRVDFEQIANGPWIVRRWQIRMPALMRRSRGGAPAIMALIERGGEIVAVQADGRDWSLPGTGSLAGTVTDRVSGRPLPGVRVALEGTPYTSVTDANGVFGLPAIPAGRYDLSLRPPSLDSVMIQMDPVPVEIAAGQALTRYLALPRPEHVLARGCRGAEGVAVGGWLRVNTVPLLTPGASIRARWTTVDSVRFDRRLPAARAGAYLLCGLPPLADVEVIVELAGNSERTRVRLPDSGVARRDLELSVNRWNPGRGAPEAPAFARAPVRVSGLVRDARTRRPLPGAQVTLGDGLPPRTTARDGTFAWEAVPPGTYVLRAAAGAGRERLVAVAAAGGGTLEIELTVP